MGTNKKIGEILYFAAFVLWMSLMILNLTYFREPAGISNFYKGVQYFVLALLVLRFVVCPEFSVRSVGKLFVLILFVFSAYSCGKLAFAVSLVLVFSVADISYEKLLRCTLLVQAIWFAVTVVCSQAGIIEDYIWNVGVRDRHGLGFTHCLLGSHFVLFMSLICVALVKKMKLWLAVFIFGANYLMYIHTDARTTMLLSLFLIVAGFAAGLFEKFVKKPAVWAAVLSFFVPFVFFAISLLGAKSFNYQSDVMMQLNRLFNNRLDLMNRAWNEYGITLFGQKIKWVGESALKNNSALTYNYVDNAYMQAFFTYGLIFIILLCIGWGLVMYRLMRRGQYVMTVLILVVLIHGLINPQMIELVYNPFFLLVGNGGYYECE